MNKKLRPVITNQQLSYIISLVESDKSEATRPIRIELIQYLKLFQVKVNLGVVSASYETQGKKSIADRLGDSCTPAERREKAYRLWCEAPHLCTQSQLEDVQLYRYENNLMSEKEESEYEEKL